MTDEELDLVETDDLVNAIARRNHSIVVLALSDPDSSDPDKDTTEETRSWYTGWRVTAVGLVDCFRHTLIRQGDVNRSDFPDSGEGT